MEKNTEPPAGSEEEEDATCLCPKCPKTFKTVQELTAHEHEHNQEEEDGTYLCQKCPKIFKTLQELITHEHEHETGSRPAKGYTCPMCDLSHVYKWGLDSHMIKRHGVRLPLDIMPKPTDTAACPDRPFHDDSPERTTYQCLNCYAIFYCREDYIKHPCRNFQSLYYRHNMPLPESAAEPDRSEITEGQVRPRSTSISRSYICKYCGLSYDHLVTLKGHLTLDHPDEGESSVKSNATEASSKASTEIDVVGIMDDERTKTPGTSSRSSQSTKNNGVISDEIIRLAEEILEQYADKVKAEVDKILKKRENKAGRRDFVCTFCGLCYHHQEVLLGHIIKEHLSLLATMAMFYPRESIAMLADYVTDDERAAENSSQGNQAEEEQKRVVIWCITCKKKISTIRELWDDLHRHLPQRMYWRFSKDKFPCEICERIFTSVRGLERHQNKHKTAKLREVQRCLLCNFTRESQDEILDHVRQDHPIVTECILRCMLRDAQVASSENAEAIDLTVVTKPETSKITPPSRQKGVGQRLQDSVQPEVTSPSTENKETTAAAESDPDPSPKRQKKGKRFPCRKCGRTFQSQKESFFHQKQRCSGKRPEKPAADPLEEYTTIHECDQCEFFCTSVQELEYHVEEQHAVKEKTPPKDDPQDREKRTCKYCGEIRRTAEELKDHKCKSMPPKKSKVEESKPGPTPKSADPIIPDPQHKCEDCTDTFPNQDELKNHACRENLPPMKCQFCEKKFLSYPGYARHLQKKHASKKNFLCPICNINYRYFGRLNRHLKQHMEKKFPEYKRWPCLICLKKFETKSEYKHHIESVHKLFGCTECRKHFYFKQDLSDHVKAEHSKPVKKTKSNYKKPLTCKKCKRRFVSKLYMDVHVCLYRN